MESWRQGDIPASTAIVTESLSSSEWNFNTAAGGGLRERLLSSPVRLEDLTHIFVGLQTSADKIYVLEHVRDIGKDNVLVRDADGAEWTLERELLRPFLSHVSLGRYERPQPLHWLIFPYDIADGKAKLIEAKVLRARSPQVWAYLSAQATALKRREGGKWNHSQWYAFGRSQNLAEMDPSKLVVQVISQSGRYAFDDAACYFTGGGNGPYYGVRWRDPYNAHSLHFLQALLNSRLLDWLLHGISTPFRGGYWSYGKRFIEQLPIRTIDFDNPADKKAHDTIVKHVETMLQLHKDLQSVTLPHDKEQIKRRIEHTDRQIDALVYELYGLTEEEIRIVEGK
jgi:hypothetical protein